MGLDFGIERRRSGDNYENLQWEECCSWRNCWDVRKIFAETIEFNDDYCYPISIGAMQILIKKLSDELQKINLTNVKDVYDYKINKLLCAIEDLSRILGEAIWNYSTGEIYEYRVFDSF